MTFVTVIPWLLLSTLLAFAARKIMNPASVTYAVIGVSALAAIGATAASLRGYVPAVWLAAGFWIVFVILPLRLIGAVNRLDVARDFAGACRISRFVRLLHPFGGWAQAPGIYAALAQAARGDFDAALARFPGLRDNPRVPLMMRLRVEGDRARLSGDWQGMLVNLDALDALARSDTERAYILAARMRALGESGQPGEMLCQFSQLHRMATQQGAPLAMLNGALFAAAFCGRTQLVRQTALRYGPTLSDESVRYWIATAALVQDGEPAAAGRAALQELARTTTHRDLQRAIELRLQAQLAPAASLAGQEDAVLDEVQAAIAVAPVVQAPARRFGLLRARATQALILLNIAAFCVELWRGDTTDGDTLYALGALWPQAVTQGNEWWRVATALFLHAGIAHIALNMLSLAALGPVIEQRYGWARFLILYFAAGLGSMAAIVGFVQWGWLDADLFVGASGAIMGLFGAFGVMVLQMRKGTPKRQARGQIAAVLALVVLQMAFDLSHPEVSLAAHEGGLFIGIAIALALAFGARRRTAGLGA